MLFRNASRLRSSMGAARAFSSKTTPVQDFRSLMQTKGHWDKDADVTSMSPAQFDKVVAADPELKEALDSANRYLQRKASMLRTRPRLPTKPPVRVAVTGAAGGIGYATLFRIASGQMLGPDQPIHLHLIELPQAKQALEGVVMELQDCAFPLLHSITATDDVNKGFDGVDFALLIGARPRTKGMERADLLTANAEIFRVQGAALNKNANRETLKVVVVGNPANTNAWIAAQCAPDINPRRFTAMTRLDHNRGLGQLALKLGVPVSQIERFAIWGNHSNTMVPDVNHVQVNDKWGRDLLDAAWLDKTFTPTVQNRGAQIIAARGASSCASAANAAIEHMRDWHRGTWGAWTSMGVFSDGSYGAEPGIYYSFPVVCLNGDYVIVQNVPIDAATAKKMEASNQELIAERNAVMPALGIKPVPFKDTYNRWKAVFEKGEQLPAFNVPSVGNGKV